MAAYGFAFAIILFFSVNIELARARAVDRSLSSDVSNGPCALMVKTRGYNCEEHEVQTQDGYILSLQRIPEGRNGGNTGGNKQPVLLQHGILVDGISWLVNSPEESLPFMLADNNFDVWIANTRGTTYSRRHVSLDSSDKAYWDWSWEELVMHDLPSNVGFVYSKTGRKLHYVGHSLGTLVALTSLSERRLVDKLKSVVLLSPVAYLSHVTTPLSQLWPTAYQGELNYMSKFMGKLVGLAEFDPKGPIVQSYLEAACRYYNCYNLGTLFTGNYCCLNASTVDVFVKYEPQPTSARNILHLSQIIEKGFVAKYDYQNPVTNMQHYGQSKPPVYNLSNIPGDIPLFIGTGEIDGISDTNDVNLLLNDLRFHETGKLKTRIVKNYGHLDVILATNANRMLYDELISFINSV